MSNRSMSATATVRTPSARYPFLLQALATTRVNTVALVTIGAVLMGALAQLTINIGVVPITGQTFGVMLLGMTLGARRAAAALASYVVLGLAGIPWFANFTGGPLMVFKPTFGYLVGFIVAAALVGWLSERGWDRHFGKSLLMYSGVSLMIYAFGVPYLWLMLHFSGVNMGLSALLWAGAFPFIPGDAIKCVLAAILSPLAWSVVSRWSK